jgi:hypothetical protein
MGKTVASKVQEPSSDDRQIKLYELLVDQILRYDAILWQLPTALIIGNLLAIEKFLTSPIPLSALAVFNLGLIFVFGRMVRCQTIITEATRNAEDRLRSRFGDFLPAFAPKHKISSPTFFTYVLWLLELGLIIYIVLLSCSPK